MQSGDGNPGSPDVTYDLVSAIYHALDSAEVCSAYLEDAQGVQSDEEVLAFYEDVIELNREIAARGKSILAQRLAAETEELMVDPEQFQPSA
jgi:hypothetical protein